MSTQIIRFEDTNLSICPDPVHEFIATTAEVAKGYDVNIKTVLGHKNNNPHEFIENKHFFPILEKREQGQPPVKSTLWTKRGIIRLGFFIKSQRARLFRDWVEDLVIETTKPNPQPAPASIPSSLSDALYLAADLAATVEHLEKQVSSLVRENLELERKLYPPVNKPAELLSRDFLMECTETAPQVISVADLYAAFIKWCGLCHFHPVAKNRFGRALTALGVKRYRTSSIKAYQGIRIKGE